MSLPAAVGSHHTVWVTPPGGRPRPVRYAVDGDRLVCFGDDGLADLPDATRVSLAIHEIAGGPELVSFGATLRSLPPDAIDGAALGELLAHVPLGRTLDEVNRRLEEHRTRRRVVELVP
jgi:hypothetical protein